MSSDDIRVTVATTIGVGGVDMEKRDGAGRHKEQPPERQSSLGANRIEDSSLDQLSRLADSARKSIISPHKSGGEVPASAQAELLKSRNKVEEVRKRIQTGYYGRPDVIGQIIDRLADDLRP
jgi:hypothetical protein